MTSSLPTNLQPTASVYVLNTKLNKGTGLRAQGRVERPKVVWLTCFCLFVSTFRAPIRANPHILSRHINRWSETISTFTARITGNQTKFRVKKLTLNVEKGIQ